MIRYLKQEEKIRTRAMYEENFPEDTKQFVDYYYKWKVSGNRILVMEGAQGGWSEVRRTSGDTKPLQVMLHLNPHPFYMCKELIDADYIVAVATDASVRKQGKMAEVMKQALTDMAAEHKPFTFLIPANSRVYESSGFAFVPSEKYEMYQTKEIQAAEIKSYNKGMHTGENMSLRIATQQDIPEMVSFANSLLQEEYDIFTWKTEAYYQRMMAELVSQDGALLLLEENGKLRGICSYGKAEEHVEIQEILCNKEIGENVLDLLEEYFGDISVQITEMNFMIRILDLRVLGLLLRSATPFSLKVQVQDDILAENCGCFELRADRNGSSISAIPQEEVECVMDIAELAKVLFGKMNLFIREWV